MSDFNPADVTVGSTLQSEVLAGDHGDEPEPPSPSQPAEREGLPSGYRMRAEDHYVDELLSRRSAARPERARDEQGAGADPLRAGRATSREERAEAAVPVDLERERHARIFEQLAEEIASIESAAALLTEPRSGLSRRVGVDLIRAQAHRAAWMLRAQALLAGTHASSLRHVLVGALLTRVRDALAAECRLAGVTLQMQAADLQATVAIDEEAVVAGITGAVVSTLGLVSGLEGAAIRVTAVALGGDLRTVEVRQDAAPVGAPFRRRCFDASWTDRPGGWVAAFAADTAHAVARLSGGDASFLARDRRGSTLRLTFSRLS